MFEKYDAYKDSSVEWIGKIPSHWEIKKNKYLFEEVNIRSENGAEELLSVSQYTGVSLKKDKINENGMLTNAESLEGYKVVKSGNLVINIMLAWNGSLGVSQYNGIVSPAYDVFLLKDYCTQYFHYLLRTEMYKAEYKRKSTGVIESRLRLYSDSFFSIKSIVPSILEQRQIAKFLEQKTSEIDQAIAIKEQQIALLNERKQIVIQKAVTQGLEPNVPMKDSGVEWIGQIPEHWVVTKLKRLTRQIVDGAHFTPTYVDKGVPFLRVTDLTSMQNGEIQWENVRYIPEKEHLELIKRAKPQKGDVLISKNGTIGVTKVIAWDVEFSIFVSLCLVKLRPSIDAKYFEAFFNSPIVDKQISFGSSRTSVTNLHLEKIKELLIILPPVEEQEIIAQEVEKINQLYLSPLNNLEEQISKLKEYKTTLINDAVTGKIKVA